MKMTRKEIEVFGWHTPAEMSALVFCPADAELLQYCSQTQKTVRLANGASFIGYKEMM